MIQVKKKKFGKKELGIVICASVLLLLIVGYAVLNSLINAGVFDGSQSGDGSSVSAPTDIREGESVYNNRGIVYPYLQKNNILSVTVKSHADSFILKRPAGEEEGSYESYFEFYYQNDDGELDVYYPDILSKEPDTDYTDFYSIEGSDGLNAYKIDYLCAAIGALYFDNRIEPESEETRAAQLSRYGLTAEKRETIYVDYLDDEGEKQSYKIFVGDKLITGMGYYFMLDGRDYIYTSVAGDTLSYLLGDFETFLHSRIVAEGLAQDSLYEPYLTTDYKQWTNTYHSMNNGGLGMKVTKDSEVVIYADLLTPKYASDGNTNIGDGYDRTGYSVDLVDLQYVAGRPEFERITALLLANPVGSYEGNEISATVVTNINAAELGKTYTYSILGVEAVLTDAGEFTEEGYPVGDGDLVTVTYTATLDGEPISDEVCHAVLDLNDPLIPEDVKAALREASIGDDLDLRYDVVYTEDNSVMRDMQLIITDINIIASIDGDGNVTYPDVITENSVVTYSYKYMVDGYEIGNEGRFTLDLGAVTEGNDLSIKNALLGRGVESGMELVAYSDKMYCQSFADFITYKIREIRGFVEKEMIVSFEFVNASERDPFYAESIYKNTLENENKFYALDSLACQNATFLLGGIGSSGNSQQSVGLVGDETVAVGLTPSVMDRYGLYDGYTVYFELPRGISAVGSDDEEALDDYRYLSTLGFTLYISKPQSDGTRYVASTMYDIVVKIDGSKFDYLEKSFEEYWARKNLAMMNYKLIDKVDISLGTSEIYGKYSFKVDHKTVYIVGNEHYDERPENGGTEYDELNITVTPSGEISSSAFSEILEREGRESLTLANLYDRVAGQLTAIGHDTAGAANFKEFLRLIYGIYYVGTMTEEEQAEALENSPRIFSMAFTLSSSPYGYVYDFYRASDRRVMVHIYRSDPSGNPLLGTGEEVSGFYVSTFAAKKIINAVSSMLNGENIDVDASYWDEIGGN